MTGSPRDRLRALAEGRGDGGGIAVPLALAPAARIQERDWEDFTEDPTELANGLRDLMDAVDPDGLVLSSPALLLEQASSPSLVGGAHASAALEATRRLRQSMGDRVALVAVLPGPVRVAEQLELDSPHAVSLVQEAGKELLGAGADVILLDDEPLSDQPALGTLANIARFHQGMAVALRSDVGGLPAVQRFPLESPGRGEGLVVTEGDLPRDTDLSVLEEWVVAVRG